MLTILPFVAALLQLLPQPQTAQDAVKAICNTVTDDPAIREELVRNLDSFAEVGRQALLTAATPGASRDWERGCAWRQLTRVRDMRVLPLLRAALTSTTETTDNRRVAMWALGEWHDQDSVPELVKLLESSDELERGEAARALGRISAEEARTALRRALDAPSDYPWDVVEAVGQQRDPLVVPRLRELSGQMDADRAFQITISIALARIGTGDALDLLEMIVERMKPGYVRISAITSALAELRLTLAGTENPGLRPRIQRAIDILTSFLEK